MLRARLNDSQKEIIRIYQETSRAKKEEKPILTRQEVSKLFFERSGTKRSSWKNSLLDSLLTKEDETDKKLAERRFPLKIETKRETMARRTEEPREPAGDITDWKNRVGLKSGLRRIYSKKQTVFRESLKDLVKKGYLERSGSGISSKYKITERALKVKIPRF